MLPRPPTGPADTGVQAERTALAWRRTALALLVISAILLRWVGEHGSIVLLPTAFALVLFVWSSVGLQARYVDKVQGVGRGRVEPEVARVLFMTCGTLALTFSAIWIVLLAR